MPASLASEPDPVTENPIRVEPLAEMVTALPFPPASITGLPIPLRVSSLVILTLSRKVPFCTSMIWPGLAASITDWMLCPDLT